MIRAGTKAASNLRTRHISRLVAIFESAKPLGVQHTFRFFFLISVARSPLSHTVAIHISRRVAQ